MGDMYGSMGTIDASGASTPERRAWGQEAGQEMSHKVQETTMQGQEAATALYEQGRELVSVWQQQLEHQVREKPLQSLLMAAGIGLLFGLLRRR